MKGELIYLACPYSHKDPQVKEERFHAVCEAAGRMMGRGEVIYAPIAHSHPIALRANLPGGWEYWKKFDEVMLSRCTELRILMLDGWEESVGVQGEIQIAQGLGLPISYVYYSEIGE